MYLNNMYYANVSPYGIKFPMIGGNVYFDSAKSLSRKGMPLANKDKAIGLGNSVSFLLFLLYFAIISILLFISYF